MLSPLPLALLAAGLAAAAALPAAPPRPVTTIADADGPDSWFGFPFFSDIFAPLLKFFPSFDLGPKIVSDDDKFQITLRVQDYAREDLKVKVKNGFLLVQGSHESKGAHDVSASQFFHTYSMPRNSSAEDVRAELSSDGWLTVTAPVSAAPPEGAVQPERQVDIVETGAPYAPAKEEAAPTKDDAAPTEDADDERREPTTPAPERDATDKDNSIPHGTDAALV